MYLKRCGQTRAAKDGVYWELAESYRTERGPRQRVVAHLGNVVEGKRFGVEQAARNQVGSWQSRLVDEEGEPEWVEVDTRRVRTERVRDFGGYWLGLEVADKLGLTSLLDGLLPRGREDVSWSTVALALVLMRLCEPSSELRIADHLYERTSLSDLLGIPGEKVNDDRLYRALDSLLSSTDDLTRFVLALN